MSCADCARCGSCRRASDNVTCRNFRQKAEKKISLSVEEFADKYCGRVELYHGVYRDCRPWEEMSSSATYEGLTVLVTDRYGHTTRYGIVPGCVHPDNPGEVLHSSWETKLISFRARDNSPC